MILAGGGAGFIGSHIAKQLKEEVRFPPYLDLISHTNKHRVNLIFPPYFINYDDVLLRVSVIFVCLQGCYVIAADWKDNEFMQPDEFCHEFHKVDLRLLDNCLKVTANCQHVYNLAADMGGMGFIVSNQSVLLYNNTMISFNMLEAARQNAAKRYFYSSTACVYNEALQMDPENPGKSAVDPPSMPSHKLYLSVPR